MNNVVVPGLEIGILILAVIMVPISISTPVAFGMTIDSPRKQMERGVGPEDVECRPGKNLMIRSLQSAICVKGSNVLKLLERGWDSILKEAAIYGSGDNLPGIEKLPSSSIRETNPSIDEHLPLLGAWGHTDLKIKINVRTGIDLDTVTIVEDAVDAWNVAIDTLETHDDFQLIILENGKADITITLRRGVGLGGWTERVMAEGEIQKANIQIVGELGSENPTVVELIVKHELGHALGLDHTDVNDGDDLMDAKIKNLFAQSKISSCNVSGFATAHSWYSRSGNTFSPPSVTVVEC
ncbi:MAG: M57 family metalloprotease [Nitrososphaerales archaeon]